MSALTSTVYTDLFQCLEGWKKYNSVDKYCPHGFVSASGGLKKYVNVPHCTVHMFVAARDGVERCVAFMVVVFSSRAGILGECSTIHSPSAFFLFF